MDFGFLSSGDHFLHYFAICRSSLQSGADGETRTLVGQCARQFTKLLLSLLSHIGEMVGRHGAAPCSAV